MGKFKKIIKNPGLFFRDYFLKRYPLVLNEAGYLIDTESNLINHQLDLYKQLPNSLDIDIVFTWVNDNDLLWRTKLDKFKKEIDPLDFGAYASDEARFQNSNELYYSLMSVLRYLPWVNSIYIVTDQQNPDWINLDSRIKVVDHREIIDEKYLPTFNSHVIEANLHKIKGLSEYFIYFNDDVFVARSLPKNHFFSGNGIASNFLTKKNFQEMRNKGVITPTLSASTTSAKLLQKSYHELIETPLAHTYIPLRKSMFHLAWKHHETEIRQFLGNRFRGKNDLNLATFLVPWLAYFEGLAVPSIDISYYFNTKSSAASMYWKILHERNRTDKAPHSFCANDFKDNHKSTKVPLLDDMLKKYFVE